MNNTEVNLDHVLHGLDLQKDSILKALNEEIEAKIGARVLSVSKVYILPNTGIAKGEDQIELQQSVRCKIQKTHTQAEKPLLIRYKINWTEKTFAEGSLFFEERELLY